MNYVEVDTTLEVTQDDSTNQQEASPPLANQESPLKIDTRIIKVQGMLPNVAIIEVIVISCLHDKTAVRSGAGTPQVPCTAVRSGAEIGLLSLFD